MLAALTVPLTLNLWLKFALLLPASVAITLASYHFVVRRVPLLRLLLGMRPRPAIRAVDGASAAALATGAGR